MTAAQKKYPSTTTRPPGRPPRVDSASSVSTSEHMLQQARKLFSERGFSAVSINDIVAAAEVSKPTLYYYYPDKEALYSAVLQQIIEQAGASVAEVMTQSLPFRGKLLRLTECFFEHSPTSLPCMMRDVTQHLKEPFSKNILEAYQATIYQPVEALFAQGIAEGHLHNSQNTHLLTELYLTMLDWLGLRFSFNEDPVMEPREKATQVVALFMDGAAQG